MAGIALLLSQEHTIKNRHHLENPLCTNDETVAWNFCTDSETIIFVFCLFSLGFTRPPGLDVGNRRVVSGTFSSSSPGKFESIRSVGIGLLLGVR